MDNNANSAPEAAPISIALRLAQLTIYAFRRTRLTLLLKMPSFTPGKRHRMPSRKNKVRGDQLRFMSVIVTFTCRAGERSIGLAWCQAGGRPRLRQLDCRSAAIRAPTVREPTGLRSVPRNPLCSSDASRGGNRRLRNTPSHSAPLDYETMLPTLDQRYLGVLPQRLSSTTHMRAELLIALWFGKRPMSP